jgi:hypothetical protein
VILPAEHGAGEVKATEEPEEKSYRTEVGEKGVRAADATLNKLVAKGMTEIPKVRFSNSILEDVVAKEADADKAKDAAVVADPNAGAPKTAETDPAVIKKQLEAAAKDAPNPNA